MRLAFREEVHLGPEQSLWSIAMAEVQAFGCQ
jgi:hypothetical protein